MNFIGENIDDNFFKQFNCINCGETPFINIKRINGCVDVRITTTGWSITQKDDVYKTTCPNCLRRLKIEKLRNASH
jgi:predicted RNA-binding Zn-ribbon protein involved in translation (DUF1610 family)